ncbi:MAG TPA: D-2-hydroxyacid dehydrogenase family protein [Bacteroidia bacterium]|nr:D-2-hydroxyacid dehydrogenase family protein [Bacteroidia bacterium]
MNIFIPDDYQGATKKLECLSVLDGHNITVLNHFSGLAKELNDADVLVLIRERTKITEALLSALPKLKLISQTGKISNHLDLEACTKYGVAVAEGTGSPIAPAELAWSLILNGKRQLPQAIAAMKEGRWQTNIGKALHGQTLGIWGYGKIGKRIANYAKAFEMKVMIWGSENSQRNAEKDGHLVAKSKEHFFATADIVSLHLRLVDSTRHIVKATDLAMMKPGAMIVNISRAELIEENALVNALQKGRPGFAAVDVYEDEPVYNKNHPLLKMPNVICTPHLGYVEQTGFELYFSKAFENIISFAKGNPLNIANPEVLNAITKSIPQ